jgi:phage terminase large subunit-like protein
VTLVSASRGKVVRAEPVAALYENKKITHAGRFPELESQLTKFSKFGYKGDRSPDRADAAIWALSELMLGDGSTYDKSLSWVR